VRKASRPAGCWGTGPEPPGQPAWEPPPDSVRGTPTAEAPEQVPARRARAGTGGLGNGPGALRAGLGAAGCGSVPKPLSTERPGPSRVTPADRAALALLALAGGEAHWRAAFRVGRWTWLPVAACTCGATPHGPARPTQPRRAPGPTSCGGLGRTYSPSTSYCQHPCDLRTLPKSAGQCGAPGGGATGPGGTVRRHGVSPAHPFGRAKTVRPATTVRSAVGRSPPGVRSGRPGVPERGSVDQLATRRSGAWTTRSPVRQTA
jgi:hypothetical protein